MKTRFVSAALVMLVLMSPSAYAQGGGPTPVRVDAVRSEPVHEQRLVTGSLQAVRLASIAAREPELVLTVAVREGMRVETGDTLAILDDVRLGIEYDILQAQRRAAEAAHAEAVAERDYRRADLAIYEEAFGRSGATDKEMLDRRSAVSIAEARAEAAQSDAAVMAARMSMLQKRRDDLTITAPFSGVVTAIHIEPGEWLDGGDAVVDVVDDSTVEAWLDVPQRWYAVLRDQTDAIRIQLDNVPEPVVPTTVEIVPMVSRDARSFTVIATLDNADHRLSPGMAVEGWIPTDQQRDHLTIMKDAVLRNDAGPFVYVVRQMSADGPPQVTPASVSILFPVDTRFAVRSDAIRPGDEIVIEGNERLFPMMPVAVARSTVPAGATP